jgi:hypothetical protein
VRAGSGDRGGKGGIGGGGGAFAQVTNICVYVPLQDCGIDKLSALHWASRNGLKSAVAKLLSLGADAALKDHVRAWSYVNKFMYSVYVMHVPRVCVCVCLSVCV